MTDDANWRDGNSKKDETYYFAKSSGDRRFITWIFDRLEHVHGENPSVDFMQTLKAFAEAGAIINKILLRQARKDHGL